MVDEAVDAEDAELDAVQVEAEALPPRNSTTITNRHKHSMVLPRKTSNKHSKAVETRTETARHIPTPTNVSPTRTIVIRMGMTCLTITTAPRA